MIQDKIQIDSKIIDYIAKLKELNRQLPYKSLKLLTQLAGTEERAGVREYFIGYDGGGESQHAAAVLGCHVRDGDRFILLKEIHSQAGAQDIIQIVSKMRDFCDVGGIEVHKHIADSAIISHKVSLRELLGVDVNLLVTTRPFKRFARADCEGLRIIEGSISIDLEHK